MKSNYQITRNANNFDFIKILFAWLVIVSHSYVLLANQGCDWLCEATNHYINFSYFGVKGFITISGYLIYKSINRSPNFIDYLWKRVLRIYPALIIVLLLSVGLAYLIYQPSNKYFKFDQEATQYILNNLTLYHNQWRIHGVFDKLPNTAINGSLWTMGFEFFFYLVLLALYPLRRLKLLSQIILLSTILILVIGNLFYIDQLKDVPFRLRVDYIFELGLFFLVGAFLGSINWDNMVYKKQMAILAAIVTSSLLYCQPNPIWLCFTWPYLVVFIGQGSSGISNWIHANIEDPSYGIYLYAFPIQQSIIYFFQPSVTVLIWSSTLIAFAFGMLSWKYIEKKTLRFKDLFRSL
jgi:peptidoglycan/LPS O-acetylase OafA/YrhL